MNARMDDIARQHITDLRHQADSHRAVTKQETNPGQTRRLRRHVGFALVEAGFYLLGTDRLAARS